MGMYIRYVRGWQERRASDRRSVVKYDDYIVHVRAKRLIDLPDTRDERLRHVERNWKRRRSHQWAKDTLPIEGSKLRRSLAPYSKRYVADEIDRWRCRGRYVGYKDSWEMWKELCGQS